MCRCFAATSDMYVTVVTFILHYGTVEKASKAIPNELHHIILYTRLL